MFRFDVATGKAWAAVGMGASSRALAARAKDNPNFFVTLAATAQGKFLPQIGGVLIRDASGTILGAAGASGGTGEEDEAVCAHRHRARRPHGRRETLSRRAARSPPRAEPSADRYRRCRPIRLEHKYRVFLVCVVGIFITVFDTSSSIIALPTIAREFGTDLPTAQWVIIGNGLTIAALLVPMGRLSDLHRPQAHLRGRCADFRPGRRHGLAGRLDLRADRRAGVRWDRLGHDARHGHGDPRRQLRGARAREDARNAARRCGPWRRSSVRRPAASSSARSAGGCCSASRRSACC